MRLLGWASDGKGLFVSNTTQEGAVLYYLDLRAATACLYWFATKAGIAATRPSRPDDRHLALHGQKQSVNMWMIGNF